MVKQVFALGFLKKIFNKLTFQFIFSEEKVEDDILKEIDQFLKKYGDKPSFVNKLIRKFKCAD